VTAEFIELRRRGANSSIVITRFNDLCADELRLSFHREFGRPRGSAIDIVYIPARTDTSGGV